MKYGLALLLYTLPGVDVKVVGGPCVFKVVNGCSKNHRKNLQLTEPMLHIHTHS